MAFRINQTELITAISRELRRQGVDAEGKGDVTCRQMSEIIRAANIVVAAIAIDDVPAVKGMGLAAWRKCDDIGSSSLYMAHVMYGPTDAMPGTAMPVYPYDPDDFGRCYRFLEAVAGSRDRLDVMGSPECGPVWRDMVAAWEELERLYLEELPTGWGEKLYARLRQIREPHEKGGAC